jgi:hypothetical protein
MAAGTPDGVDAGAEGLGWVEQPGRDPVPLIADGPADGVGDRHGGDAEGLEGACRVVDEHLVDQALDQGVADAPIDGADQVDPAGGQ